jgi:hypothetical protein
LTHRSPPWSRRAHGLPAWTQTRSADRRPTRCSWFTVIDAVHA